MPSGIHVITHIGFAHYPTNLRAGTQAHRDVVPATIITPEQAERNWPSRILGIGALTSATPFLPLDHSGLECLAFRLPKNHQLDQH